MQLIYTNKILQNLLNTILGNKTRVTKSMHVCTFIQFGTYLHTCAFYEISS